MTKKDAEKLVRHPTRVQIVGLLTDRTMSPNAIADEIGATLGTTAYHVRTLEKFGAIRLVKETRVRGAIEHHYTLRKPAREPIRDALQVKMSKERSASEKILNSL